MIFGESFTGTDADPIGGNWTSLSFPTGTTTSIKRVSNLAVQTAPSGSIGVSGGAAYYNAASPLPDSFAKITIDTLVDPGNYWPYVRIDDAGKNAYTALFDCGANLGAPFRVAIFKYIADVFTLISSIVPWTATAPSVLEIRAVGSTISALQNGVVLVSVVDADVTAAGRSGFRVFGGAAVSDFLGGDFNATSINFPAGDKLRGMNIIPGNSLNTFWPDFETQWPMARKQIDHSYAVGCNVVRFIGDIQWATIGSITPTQYHDRWQVVLDHIASLGMYCYPCASGVVQLASTGFSNSTIITRFNAWLAAIAHYGNIIGIDLANEVNSWPGKTNAEIQANMAAIYTGVKAGGTAFPLTWSTYENMATYPCVHGGSAACDYLDFHVYKAAGGYADYPTSALIFSGPLTLDPGHEVMGGEFGDPISDGPTHNANWFNACWSMFNDADSQIRGSIQWAAYDQDVVPANQFGLLDLSFNPRSFYAAPCVNNSSSVAGPLMPGDMLLTDDDVLLWSPAGTTTDFASTKLYRNDSVLETLQDGYYELPQPVDSLYHYKATVVSGAGESAKTDIYYHPGRLAPDQLRRRVKQTFR